MRRALLAVVVLSSFSVSPVMAVDRTLNVQNIPQSTTGGRWQIFYAADGSISLQKLFLIDTETGRTFFFLPTEAGLVWSEIDVIASDRVAESGLKEKKAK